MGRALIIGDIHGCFEELRDLLDAAALTAEDEIISLGDMVDRGPQSAKVATFFRDHPQASAVRGNHEQKHISSRRGRLQPSLAQNIARREMGEPLHAVLCDWMDTLPLFIQRPEALLIHGFFEAGVALRNQKPHVLMGTMSGERRLIQDGSRAWFQDYDHTTPVIVGHRDYNQNGQPFVYQDRVFGLDTTVYAGGRLTGIVLPEFRFVSVAARSDHWAHTREQNADLRYSQAPPESLSWQKARSILAAYRRHPPLSMRHRRRQQRISAMLHAAEQSCALLLDDIQRVAQLEDPERRHLIAQHPHRCLIERQIHGSANDLASLEDHFKRPAQLLCAVHSLRQR